MPKGHQFLERAATDEEFDDFVFKNVGIVTGKTSGIVVLDVDDGGPNTLKEQGWTIPPTVTVKTIYGRHYYFRYPSDAERLPTRVRFAKGLDFKADGGYVVAAPSVVSRTINEKGIKWSDEHTYAWIPGSEDLGIAECPEWLLKAVRERSEPLRVDVSGSIEEGTRNNTLYSYGLSLKRGGLDDGSIREALHYMNTKRCRPALPDDEVDSIAGSVARSNVKRGELREYEGTTDLGVLMSDVESEEVRWLWDRRIPLGKLTLLEGDPDWGKSAITMDLAARVTTGMPMPQHDTLDHVEPLDPLDLLGGVVILNAEDGLGDTIRPRLEAAGADLTKVRAILPMKPDNDIVSIPRDIPTIIESEIEKAMAKLLIIDPLSAFMHGDPNKDSDVRKALTPLAEMAQRTGVAVVVVRHFNKNADAKALYRGGGSIGIIGAARSALAVAPHPNDDELRVLVPQKGNLSKKAQSLSYNIVTGENGAARIEWRGTIDLNADELLNVNQGELARAKAWLIDELKDGPVPYNEIKAAAAEVNISESTLKRAKAKLPVQSEKDGPNGQWRWHLVQGVQECQEAQEDQDGQHDRRGTESDCECGKCIHCLKQELPLDIA